MGRALAPIPGGLLDSSCLPALTLPVWLADWYVARERELAAAGDTDAEARLAAVLEGSGHER